MTGSSSFIVLVLMLAFSLSVPSVDRSYVSWHLSILAIITFFICATEDFLLDWPSRASLSCPRKSIIQWAPLMLVPVQQLSFSVRLLVGTNHYKPGPTRPTILEILNLSSHHYLALNVAKILTLAYFNIMADQCIIIKKYLK